MTVAPSLPADGTAPPSRWGRFELRRQLGAGDHAVAWLAFDPRSRREVVLRLLTLRGDEDPNQVARWLARARNLVRLQHPNIVPVLEADLQGAQPYLVMGYEPGQTLAQRLAEGGPLPAPEAVALACSLLEGLAAAHAAGQLHRDLRSSNVLVGAQGQALLMDFALPSLQAGGPGHPAFAAGATGHVAPETAQGQAATAASDLFGVGLLLAEMVCGKPLLDPQQPEQARYRVQHEQLALPDPPAGPLDPGLRAILQKALARDPLQRPADAQALRAELLRWPELPAGGTSADEGGEPADEEGSTVLQGLLKRMRSRSDFPAMSDAVVRIQALTNSDSESIGNITNEILKDVALTNKLLRLVNSAHYARPGGDSIRTVSRAVSLIGLNGIRNLSLSLVLLEHMRDRSHADMLKEEFLRCLLAGALGGEFCLTSHDAEEAFITAMFQNLGRLLAGYYFPEEARTIRGLVAARQQPMGEEAAAASVLGLGFEELGQGVAHAWGLPASIQHCLHKPLGQPPAQLPASPAERQRWTAFAANSVADLLLRSERKEFDARLDAFAARHAKVLGRRPEDMLQAVRAGRLRFIGMVEALQLQVPAGSPAARLLVAPTEEGSQGATTAAGGGDALDALAMQAARPTGTAQDAAARRTQILAAGIQDITQVMVEEHKLNDVLRMILETMLRALELRWIVFCLREPKAEALTGRFGLGVGVERVVRAFHVPVKAGTSDLMGAVCVRGLDTQISDATEGRITERLPAWFHQHVQAPAFLLLPMQMQGRPFGLIYGDMAQKNQLRLDERELALLRTLRNQAIMAFKRGA